MKRLKPRLINVPWVIPEAIGSVFTPVLSDTKAWGGGCVGCVCVCVSVAWD
jgi:hypothetical protein